MWIAGKPSDGMCYHKHKLPSLPDVLHISSVVTHITPFRKDHLAILSSWPYAPQVLYIYNTSSSTSHQVADASILIFIYTNFNIFFLQLNLLAPEFYI